MKNLVTFIALGLLGVAVGDTQVEMLFSYHEDEGIPLAKEIYEAESKATEEYDSIGRIIGGSPSKLGLHKHVAGLLIDLTSGKQSVCGSTLVSNDRLVTAAHCWFDGKNQGKEVTAVFESLKLYSGGTRIKSKDITMHESWNHKMLTNDILIIKIQGLKLTDNIKPAKLPSDDMKTVDFVGKKGTIAGYGRTASDASGAITRDQILRYVELTIAKNDVCKKKFGRYMTDNNMCITGPNNKAQSSCQGDSGSGLIVEHNKESYICAVVSFGGKFCDKPSPVIKVFTSVIKYLDWINKKIGK